MLNLFKQIRDVLPIDENQFKKNRRRCRQTCKQHLFSLVKKQGTSRKIEGITQVLFCPKIKRNQQTENTFPQFNKDGFYYTQSFILGVDKKQIQEKNNQQLLNFNKSVKESLLQKTKMQFPVPNSKHNRCSVCKVEYNKYLTHIFTNSHKKCVKNNRYNKFIDDLSSKFYVLQEQNRRQVQRYMKNQLSTASYEHVSSSPKNNQKVKNNSSSQKQSRSSSQNSSLQSIQSKDIEIKKKNNDLLYNKKVSNSETDYDYEIININVNNNVNVQTKQKSIQIIQKAQIIQIVQKQIQKVKTPIKQFIINIEQQKQNNKISNQQKIENIQDKKKITIQKQKQKTIQTQKQINFSNKQNQKISVKNICQKSSIIIKSASKYSSSSSNNQMFNPTKIVNDKKPLINSVQKQNKQQQILQQKKIQNKSIIQKQIKAIINLQIQKSLLVSPQKKPQQKIIFKNQDQQTNKIQDKKQNVYKQSTVSSKQNLRLLIISKLKERLLNSKIPNTQENTSKKNDQIITPIKRINFVQKQQNPPKKILDIDRNIIKIPQKSSPKVICQQKQIPLKKVPIIIDVDSQESHSSQL